MQVGERAFQPVADLDAHLAVVLDDKEQDAVVLAGLAEGPRPEQPVGVVLQWLAIERVDGGDDDLVGALFLEIGEFLGERGLGRRVHQRSIVDDAAGQRRQFGGERGGGRADCRAGRRATRRQHEPPSSCRNLPLRGEIGVLDFAPAALGENCGSPIRGVELRHKRRCKPSIRPWEVNSLSRSRPSASPSCPRGS